MTSSARTRSTRTPFAASQPVTPRIVALAAGVTPAIDLDGEHRGGNEEVDDVRTKHQLPPHAYAERFSP
jgi:hypothetical protein